VSLEADRIHRKWVKAVLQPVYRYAAQTLRVIDGDTIVVRVDLGFRAHIDTPLRLLGVNAPEHGTPAGDAATAYTTGWLNAAFVTAKRGPALVIDSAKPGEYSGDKYGRWLATVWDQHGACLNEDLVSAGHAVPYHPGADKSA
jgi:micrococcal nuclease